jgi:hypothetical protein
VDPSAEKIRGYINELRGAIDDALDHGAGDATLRELARLLRHHKTQLVQLEKAELNRQAFRLR